jgi:small conductance mechanosensitive channel
MVKKTSFLWLVAIFLSLAVNAWANTEVEQTAAFSQMSKTKLSFKLSPMFEQELGEEAETWQKALQSKAQQVSQAELAVREVSEQMANLDDKNLIAEQEKTKAALVEDLTELRLEQEAISERLEIVLQEWKKKGGEIEAIEQYRKAVAGVHIDVKDTSGTWLFVSNWLSSEDGGIFWIKKFLRLAFALVLFALFYKLITKVSDKALDHSKISYLMTSFLKKTIRRILITIGVLLVLTALEFNIGPILAVIGAAGLVIGLALQNTLSNFASGLLILIYRPFDLDDYIEVAGVSGLVTEMTLLSTRIKTRDNKVLTIPNNHVWEGVITNYTESKMRRVDLIFGIAYGDDFEKAKRIISDVVKQHEFTLDDPEPIVRVTSLGDSSVNITCYPWVPTDKYWDVYWDLQEQVKHAFDDQGISIPFPQRDIHIISQPSQS